MWATSVEVHLMPRQTTTHTKLGRLIRTRPGNMGDLAAATGINYVQISKYVNQHAVPTPAHRFKIAAYFGVEPEDIMGMCD